MRREDLLREAADTVTRHRQSSYGTPEDNFGRIAEFWRIYKGVEFSKADVAMMMILVKVARQVNSPGHADNYLDIAGYAACGCEVACRAEAGGGSPPAQEAAP